ncbi:hypothetical protein V6Z11_A09G062800 [Gossypium hirsutum]
MLACIYPIIHKHLSKHTHRSSFKTLQENRLLAAFFLPLAAFLSVANTFSAFSQAPQKTSLYATPLKTRTFSGAFLKNTAKDQDLSRRFYKNAAKDQDFSRRFFKKRHEFAQFCNMCFCTYIQPSCKKFNQKQQIYHEIQPKPANLNNTKLYEKYII